MLSRLCLYIYTLFVLFCGRLSSSETSVYLEFVIPGLNELISTRLSMQSHEDVTFYKIIRSVLYIDNIIMDCSFTFDTNNFNTNTPLICDINNACISSLDSKNKLLFSTKLHLENLGIGDLEIGEIRKINKENRKKSNILFYDNLLCIGDSNKCDGHRYIDFISNEPEIQSLKATAINAQIHNKLQCNSKDTVYPTIKSQKSYVSDSHSNRKLLAINNNDFYYKTNQINTIQHYNYMDIILTIVLLIMILISLFNMSYAFNIYQDKNNKNKTSRFQRYDTRRV